MEVAIDEIRGSGFGFNKDEANVLADDSHAEELHGAHEEDDDDGARPAAREGVNACDRLDQNPRHERECESRRGEPEICNEAKRRTAEADKPVDRQSEEIGVRVLRRAAGSRRSIIFEPGLAETDITAQPANKTSALGKAFDGIDDFLIHRAKVAAIDRDRCFANHI